jgi:hypothetical protein
VLTRKSNHWSQHVSDDNPRGYSDTQQQKIADAGTLVKKRGVELHVMRGRLTNEMNLKEPIDDEYGTERINAMIAEINAEYAAKGVIIGVTHNAGVVSTEDDQDEDSDSDSHESRLIRRYVYLSIHRYAVYYTYLFLFHAVSCIFHMQAQCQHRRYFQTTGLRQPLESSCHYRQPARLR